MRERRGFHAANLMNARQRGETDNVVIYLDNRAKFFGILKRKHKTDIPSPLDFLPKLLTAPSIP
jgi:hypothetical protein